MKSINRIILISIIIFTFLYLPLVHSKPSYSKKDAFKISFYEKDMEKSNDKCLIYENKKRDIKKMIKGLIKSGLEIGDFDIVKKHLGNHLCRYELLLEINEANIEMIEAKDSFKLKKIKNGFSIDPLSKNNLIQVLYNASGSAILKCEDWDFNSDKCLGNWKKYMDTKPGEEYLISIKGSDPAFVDLIAKEAYDSGGNNVTLLVDYYDGYYASQGIGDTYWVNATFSPGFSQSEQIPYAEVGSTIKASTSGRSTKIEFRYLNYTDNTWHEICSRTISSSTTPKTYICDATDFFNINKSIFTYQLYIKSTSSFFPIVWYVDWMYLGLNTTKLNQCAYIKYPGTYKLESNISHSSTCIIIDSENVSLDCNNYYISGENYGAGIYINNVDNVSIKNCNIKNFGYGIYAYYSDYSLLNSLKIENVSIYGNYYGFYGINVVGSKIKNTNISSNVIGLYTHVFDNSTIENAYFSNNANGELVLNWTWDANISNTTIDGNLTSKYYSLQLLGDCERINSEDVNITHPNAVLIVDDGKDNEFKNLSVFSNQSESYIKWHYVITNSSSIYDNNFYISKYAVALNSTDVNDFNKSFLWRVNDIDCGKIFLRYMYFSSNESYIWEKGESIETLATCENNGITTEMDSFSSYLISNLNKCAYLTIPNVEYNITTNLYGNKSDAVCITIGKENISLRGNSFNITGNNTGTTYAISLDNTKNIEVKGINLKNYTYGFSIYNSTIINISSLNISNSTYGIDSYELLPNFNKDEIRIVGNYFFDLVYSITLTNTSYVEITNNSFENISSVNIWISNATSINIKNMNGKNIGETFLSSSALYNTSISLLDLYNVSEEGVWVGYFKNSNFSDSTINKSNVAFSIDEGVGVKIHNIKSDEVSSSNYFKGMDSYIYSNKFYHCPNIYEYSLYLDNSDNVSIENNSIYFSYYGIGFENSNLSVYGNIIRNYNDSAIVVINSYKNSIIKENELFNSLLSGKFGIYISNATNLVINKNNISTTDFHIYLTDSNNISISENRLNFTKNTWYSSIYITNSYDIEIENNDFNSTFYGIRINEGNATMSNNTFYNLNNSALVMENNNIASYFSNNYIDGITTSSASALYFSNSNNSKIFTNKIENVGNGVSLFSSYYNLFYNNIFNATSTNVYDENTQNFWNASYDCSTPNIIGGRCIGGNYYSDYSGVDEDADGIGETSYTIWGSSSSTQDYLPLTNNLSIRRCFYAKQDNFVYNLEDNLFGNKSDTNCITIEASNVTINCSGYVIEGSDSRESAGTIGIYLGADYDNLKIENCEILNYSEGIDIITGDYATIVNSSIHEFGGVGIRLSNSQYSTINNTKIFDSLTTTGDIDYGVYLLGSGTSYMSLNNIEISNSSKAIFSTTSPHIIRINNATIKGGNNALSLYGYDITISNSSLSSCKDYCIYESSNTNNLKLDNVIVYDTNYYANITSGNTELINFSIGKSKYYGIINWGYLSLATADIVLEENESVKLGEYFVSLDSSNPKVSQLNTNTNITLKVDTCAHKIYKKSGFPLYREDITNNGSVYVPSGYNTCNGNKRIFEGDGFSGYATGVKEGEWWNCSFSSRIKYNILYNGSLNVSGYTVLLEINHTKYPAYLFAKNGSDIRVVDSNNIELPYYVESFNVNGTTRIFASVNLNANKNNSVYVYFGANVSNSGSSMEETFTKYLEVGSFTLPSQSHVGQWVLNVSFPKSINNPVLILGPDVTYAGSEEATTRVRNLDNDGFEAKQQEPSNRDDTHTSETIHYMAMPEGVYKTPDGLKIEARRLTTSTASGGDIGATNYDTISFSKAMDNPVVVSSVIDYSSTNWVHTRQRNVGSTSFQICLEPEGDQGPSSVSTSLIGWIAIEQGSGIWDSKNYESSTTPNSVTGNFYNVYFSKSYSNPRFVASMQTVDGGDSAILRGRNLGSSSIEVRVQEDTTYDSETGHTTEQVGYFVFEDGIYPLTEYVENVSSEESYSNMSYNLSITEPQDGSLYEINESFGVNCLLSHDQCVGCSNETKTYLQFFDENTGEWEFASTSTTLYVDSNGISNNLASNQNATITFNAKITEMNKSYDIRCLAITGKNATIRSDNITVSVPNYNISLIDPQNLDIVYAGASQWIKVDEMYGKPFITQVNIKIDGNTYNMTETSPNHWEYLWSIDSSQPEGFLTLTAYGYDSAGNIIANDSIEVYVKKEVVCEWWNASFDYKIPVVVKNPSDLDLTEFIFAISFDQNSFDYSLAQPKGEDVRVILDGQVLPMWIEKWNENGESTIWTKINISANSGKIIEIYFGNETSVDSVSNRSEVFSYDNPKEIYYTLYPNSGSVNLTSYVESNNIIAGSNSYTLNRQQVATTSYTNGMPINASYPIAGTMIGNNRDSIIPISFAGKTFVYPFGARTSSTDQFIIYSPFNDASVSIYSNSALVTSTTVNAGTTSTITADIQNNQNAIIESDEPILVFHKDTSNRDSVIMHPASTEWYGISSSGYVSVLNDNTRVEIYTSGGDYSVYTLDRNGILYVGYYGSQGSGAAIRIKASGLVGALQRADADGSEETTFLPPNELDNEYILSTSAQYITIACPYDNTSIKVYGPSGNLLTQTTCTIPAEGYPGKAYFGSTSNGVNYVAGTLINSSKPIYVYYEDVESGDSSGEETNILSWKQLRYYSPGVKYNLGKIENKTSDLEVIPFFIPNEKRECEDINFSAVIINRKVDVDAFNVSFIVYIGSSSYLIEEEEIPSLSCGDNVTLNFSLNHTNKACGLGLKTLKVMADYDDIINETDETNNYYYDTTTYYKAMESECKNSISVTRNITDRVYFYFKIHDRSIYNITEINLTYEEGSPPLPASCVDLNETYFPVIENNSYKTYLFSINSTCAPNGSSYGRIKTEGKDFASDHNLTTEYCNGTFTKTENGIVYGPDIIDYEVVEPGQDKEINITIHNEDELYNIINETFEFEDMYALPSSNTINKSNLSAVANLPIFLNSSRNQTGIINLSNDTMPGKYNGTVNISFIYDDNISTSVFTYFKTQVRVPYIYDVDEDGKNEWVFDDDNDGNPDELSYYDDYGDITPSTEEYESLNMSTSGKRAFLIDTTGDLKPDKYWDPSYYNNASGLVTDVNETDSNNDGVNDYLIDNDDDGIYERVYDGGKDYSLPDLVAEDIFIDPQMSTKPKNITITATINNSGEFNASNFQVGLYINGSYVKNTTISFLATGDKTNVSFNYSNSDTGNFSVQIRVDLTNVIYESNDTRQGWNNTNNIIDSWFFSNITHWHIIYGNISSTIILSDNNSIFYNWTWKGEGNVYVTSQNSTPDLTNLQAIGRNENGSASSSDFDELDYLLSFDGYSDNTRNLYSTGDGTTPKNITNITFLYYKIENVSIAPSSDFGSDFVTGILWDKSDDTNGEFDDVDNEDLIFISPIKRNATGSFGTYDYEIRVPGKFDTYKGGNYVEIWIDLR